MIVLYKHLAGQHNQQTHASGEAGYRDISDISAPRRDHPYYQINRSGATIYSGGVSAYSKEVDSQQLGGRNNYGKKEQLAMNEYTSGSYEAINNTLRGKPKPEDLSPETQKMVKTTVKNLDSAFEGSYAKENIVVYRGVTGRTAQTILDGIQKEGSGFTIQDLGYTSASADKLVWQDSPIYMKIRVKKGTPCIGIRPFSRHPRENEVLFPRGSYYQFALTEIDDDGRVFHIFDIVT